MCVCSIRVVQRSYESTYWNESTYLNTFVIQLAHSCQLMEILLYLGTHLANFELQLYKFLVVCGPEIWAMMLTACGVLHMIYWVALWGLTSTSFFSISFC